MEFVAPSAVLAVVALKATPVPQAQKALSATRDSKAPVASVAPLASLEIRVRRATVEHVVTRATSA